MGERCVGCLNSLRPSRSITFISYKQVRRTSLLLQVFVEYTQPKDLSNGQLYQKTLLGVILNISCLLKTPGVIENHGYFLNPSRSSPQEIKVQEANIHQVELFMVYPPPGLRLSGFLRKQGSSWESRVMGVAFYCDRVKESPPSVC